MEAFSNPIREVSFQQIARSNRQHDQRGISLRRDQAIAIERKQQTDSQKGSALVAIDKRMVFIQTNAISRSQISDIRRRVERQIDWARKGRFQQAFVA
jgi:hypothetical protein